MKRLNFTVAFVGAGNMAEALFAGFIASGLLKPSQIIAVDVRAARLNEVRRRYGIRTCGVAAEAVRSADIVFLAVKPQQAGDVLAAIGPVMMRRQLLISIVAGATIRFMRSFLSPGVPVIRSMPNTPALVAAGAVAVAAGPGVTASQRTAARSLFSTVGIVVELAEKHLNAVTALSGSGPAYVFLLCEAMVEAARRIGLSGRVAEQLARQTVHGAGLLLARSSDAAGELRRKVTSPGGTTAAAIAYFEKKGLAPIVTEAVRRACARAGELSQ